MSKSPKPTNGTAPNRPALRYPGAKWTLAPWIISHLPIGLSSAYTEAYGGSAGVLLQKPIQPVEVYNDLNDSLVNFFKVLRERPGALIRLIRLTPYSRTEHQLSRIIEPDINPLEWARKTFIFHWMSISNGRATPGGWHLVKGLEDRYTTPPYNFININHLYAVANRFKYVQIEKLPALELLARYDKPETLHYVDPPYHPKTRTEQKLYKHELNTVAGHTTLLEALLALTGYVVLSGYSNPLYQSMLEEGAGWHRIDKDTQANSGIYRTESLYLSPKTWEALQITKQLTLGV